MNINKAYSITCILLAPLFTGSLNAEDREKGERERGDKHHRENERHSGESDRGKKDSPEARYHAAERELKAAVEAGKISREDAFKRLESFKKKLHGEQEHNDPRKQKYHAAEKELKAAVEAGKISREDAMKKLGAIKGQIWGDKGQEKDHHDPRGQKFQAIEEKVWSAVKAGKLSKEDAMKKLGAMKDQIWGNHDKGHERSDRRPDHEQDDLRHWAMERRQEIEELKKAGRHEEAEKIAHHTRRIMDERMRGRGENGRREQDHNGNRQELERWFHEQERHIHELREKGRHEEADRAERDLRQKVEAHQHEQEGEHHDRGEHTDERVHHAMTAIEHLHAAGLHDLAEEVERRVNEQHQGQNRDQEHHDHNGGNEVKQLRHEVEQMRRMLDEIRRHLGDGNEHRR